MLAQLNLGKGVKRVSKRVLIAQSTERLGSLLISRLRGRKIASGLQGGGQVARRLGGPLVVAQLGEKVPRTSDDGKRFV